VVDFFGSLAQGANTMQSRVQNHLASLRRSRGIGASDLARTVGVSRQTIYAIEAGTYVPNTEVALRISRELEVSVDQLFTLEDDLPKTPESIDTDVLSSASLRQGQPMRVCEVEHRLISIPVDAAPYFIPEADGVLAKTKRATSRAELIVFAKEEGYAKKLVLAGCDPAIGLVARLVEKLSGVELVSAAASSKLALAWLRDSKVHIAGSHLRDTETGEFNLPYLRQEFPNEDLAVITFARWEQGFIVSPSNPLEIKKPEDLLKKTVRFVNREAGSGSRMLLDRVLGEAKIPGKKVQGYERLAFGHLAAAYAVKVNEADCCVASRSAAQIFGLDFVPLQSERYDFVMRRQALELPAVQAFLDVLQRASLRRKLQVLAGYDTSETGALIA
jgi:putative molybdopterin biosynthesis protein